MIVVSVVASLVAVAALVVLGYLTDALLRIPRFGEPDREDDIRVPFTR